MEHKPTPELIEEVKSAATTAKQDRKDNIASIMQEYGSDVGKFVEVVSEALLLSKGIIQVGLSGGNGKEDSVIGALSQLLAVDMLSKLGALMCESTAKACKLTDDQAKEALAMAKEIADKVADSIDPILEREKAKEAKNPH